MGILGIYVHYGGLSGFLMPVFNYLSQILAIE